MTESEFITPFKTVAIGITFSPNLEANIYEAVRLARMFRSRLILIHVGKRSNEKKEAFVEIINRCNSEVVPFTLFFSEGDPVEVILQAVKKYKVDLLLLGALQRENILKYYIGSIARKITRQAPCSVLLLIKPSVERIACKHIVVNGINEPKNAKTITTAFYVGQQLGADHMTIVEEISEQELAIKVRDDKSLREAMLHKERIRLREDSRIKKLVESLPQSLTQRITVANQPIFGRRGYSIGHYAEVRRADLLVMTHPGRMRFLDRLFPHDVEHILNELPTDVLFIQ